MNVKRLTVLFIALAASLTTVPVRAESVHQDATCASGYVWREAFPGDLVCVTPEARDQAAYDNSQASVRIDPQSPYGEYGCKAGFVWRVARPEDLVCVRPNIREQTAIDNSLAATRLASAAQDISALAEAPSSSDQPIPESIFAVTASSFDADVVKSKGLILVTFWAAWCGPCRAILPTLEQVVDEHEGQLRLAKFDADTASESALKKLGVTTLPTLMLFKDGRRVERFVGNLSKTRLLQKIRTYLR